MLLFTHVVPNLYSLSSNVSCEKTYCCQRLLQNKRLLQKSGPPAKKSLVFGKVGFDEVRFGKVGFGDRRRIRQSEIRRNRIRQSGNRQSGIRRNWREPLETTYYHSSVKQIVDKNRFPLFFCQQNGVMFIIDDSLLFCFTQNCKF